MKTPKQIKDSYQLMVISFIGMAVTFLIAAICQ